MAEARTALAEIHSEFEWDFPNAEREFRRALQENPNYALAHQWYAAYLSAMGRFSEAIAEMQSASELQPAILGTNLDLGRAYYFARQYDRAIRQYEEILRLDPNYSAAHSMLGMALLEKKDYDRAITQLQNGIALVPDGQSVWLAYAYALAGRRQEANRELAKCFDRFKKRNTGGVCISLAYAGLGDMDRAFDWLEQEFEARTSTIFMLKAYPYWDTLRSDRRYRDLLRRAGLPQ